MEFNELEWAQKALKDFLATAYPHLTVDEVEPSHAKGYWRIKQPCGGRKGGCHHHLHGTLGNEGPTHHTIHLTDDTFTGGRDTRGRFTKRYEIWRILREAHNNGGN